MYYNILYFYILYKVTLLRKFFWEIYCIAIHFDFKIK